MSSLTEEAAQNPDAALFDLDPFVEMDLHLIISVFEESNKSSGTEDGFLLSAYGDIGKQKGRLGSFRDSTNMYGGMHAGASETGDAGTVSAEAGIDPATGLAYAEVAWEPPPNPFSDCFPCDFRLEAILDSLPMPDFLQWFEDIIKMVENFIKVLMNLMDPTNYYADLCMLIDMTRVICPQDLTLLLVALGFMIAQYIKLLIQFDFDWLALVGMIFMPLLLLLYSLLDMMGQLNIPPMLCLIDVMETMLELAQAAGGLAGTAAEVGGSVTFEGSASADGASATAGFGTAATTGNVLNHPITKDFMDDDMAEAMQEIRAVESLMLSISSFNIGMPKQFEQIKKVLRVLIEMMSGGQVVKLQVISALIQLARMIGFIKAMIDLIKQGDAICTDPEIPLSAEDVQNVLERLQSSTYSSSQALPPSTSVTLDQTTGTLSVADTVSGQVVEVPTCLGATSQESRDKINEWIQQLDAANL
jgi:hypothetical protein